MKKKTKIDIEPNYNAYKNILKTEIRRNLHRKVQRVTD